VNRSHRGSAFHEFQEQGNRNIRNRDLRYPNRIKTIHQGDACQEISKSQSSGDWGFQRQRLLATLNRDPRHPDGRAMWATTGVSGGQVSPHIEGSGKGKSRVHRHQDSQSRES
jgi:hypothetical protein